MPSPDDPPVHLAVDRALTVITYLGTRPDGAPLQEISAATGIPKPSLHRTLRSMRARGFASQLVAGGDYLLGPAALEAAFRFHADLDLRQLTHPLMLDIQELSGQTVHLARLHGSEVVYVDKLESRIGVRLTSVIGGRNPASCTGVGKALLAEKLTTLEAAEDWVAEHGPLVARAPNSITDPAHLFADLVRVRERGYAIDDEESESSLLCVAAVVPLVFGAASPRLAISVTGLKERMTELGIAKLGESLTEHIRHFDYSATRA